MATEKVNPSFPVSFGYTTIRASLNLKSSVIGPAIVIDHYLPVLGYYLVTRVTDPDFFAFQCEPNQNYFFLSIVRLKKNATEPKTVASFY